MRRIPFVLVAAALLLPATALAKGPTSATLEGPGAEGISFSGYETPGPDLGELAQQAGFWAATLGESLEPLPATRPAGDLGPKLTITYVFGPGVPEIRQDVYPYATPAPVTYTPSGQEIFDRKVDGGWYRAEPELKTTLVAAGLPATAQRDSSDGSSFPTAPVSVLAFALLVVCATALLLRRRTHPAAA